MDKDDYLVALIVSCVITVVALLFMLPDLTSVHLFILLGLFVWFFCTCVAVNNVTQGSK